MKVVQASESTMDDKKTDEYDENMNDKQDKESKFF